MRRRLPVILDIDAPEIERDDEELTDVPWTTDGIENAHFVRLRPRDCEDGPRPCPWLNCRYHNGEKSTTTCAIDVADSDAGRTDGLLSLRDVGRIMGISNVRVLQLERSGIRKLLALRDEVDADDELLAGT